QAVVLCAVARELGVTDEQRQVELLAAVLCGRDLTVEEIPADAQATPEPHGTFAPKAIAKALWNLVGVLRAIGGEVAKRPHPRAPFRYLGMLPAVGAVAGYFGELGALSRAAKAGRQWIAAHPGPST
ncbi:MAG: hypothetical protein K0R68_2954, partial [Mycobacterium sp.]|nr:hypothetical protein [Mycobacterium sp.]